ncbi:MAG: hypothetical protein CME59_16255 [Halioglobus sp.]|nr:hypothetical protein [Halioglobus sp.]|tara:strand:- start:8129 stop:8737 length:609 start_codon:yes stop_codon:yes gene_type:complete
MSVRLMFRQLAIEGLRLRTPAFVDTAEIATEGIHRSTRFDFVIARESVLELEAQQVGSPFSGVEVDVLGHVKNVPFVIYCTYPGRAIPTVIRRPEIKRCGVLELNLTATAPVFLEEKSGRYTDVLRTCIEHSTTGRSWVYHPRYDAAKEEAEKRALARLAEQEPSEKAAAKRGYQCLACGHQWRGTTDKCSHCNTHLYAART